VPTLSESDNRSHHTFCSRWTRTTPPALPLPVTPLTICSGGAYIVAENLRTPATICWSSLVHRILWPLFLLADRELLRARNDTIKAYQADIGPNVLYVSHDRGHVIIATVDG